MTGLEFVGRLLDAYSTIAWCKGVVAESSDDGGVPPEMFAGPVDDEGWVDWRISRSTLNVSEVTSLEKEIGAEFPPLFRAYLLARFQLFDQVKSRKYDQPIMMSDTPAGKPLKPLTMLIQAWQPLCAAGYVPFAEWGDGWGPMCFDVQCRRADGDCPIVWLDHELLIDLGEDAMRDRVRIVHLAQPLYESCREFLIDVFSRE